VSSNLITRSIFKKAAVSLSAARAGQMVPIGPEPL
jgi:hypothetical protein